MVGQLRVLGVVAMLTVLTAVRAESQADCWQSELRLEEVAHWAVPDSFTVSDVVAGSPSTYMAWGARAEVLELSQGRSPQRVPLPQGVRVVGMRQVGFRAWELLDAGRAEVFSLEDGRVASAGSVGLPAGLNVVSGEGVERGWLIGTLDSLGTHFTVWRKTGAGLEVVVEYPAISGDGKPIFYGLRSIGSKVLVSQATFPFGAELVDVMSGTRTPLEAPPDSLFPQASTNSQASSGWRFLSGLQVGCGLLLDFADLTSDGRVLAFYKPNGVFVRAKAYHIPFSLIRKVEGKAEVLGARRAATLEIVSYMVW